MLHSSVLPAFRGITFPTPLRNLLATQNRNLCLFFLPPSPQVKVIITALFHRKTPAKELGHRLRSRQAIQSDHSQVKTDTQTVHSSKQLELEGMTCSLGHRPLGGRPLNTFQSQKEKFLSSSKRKRNATRVGVSSSQAAQMENLQDLS